MQRKGLTRGIKRAWKRKVMPRKCGSKKRGGPKKNPTSKPPGEPEEGKKVCLTKQSLKNRGKATWRSQISKKFFETLDRFLKRNLNQEQK